MTLLNLQVCTTLTDGAEIERRANEVSPAGTTNGWSLDRRPEVAPVACEEYPERRHCVLAC